MKDISVFVQFLNKKIVFLYVLVFYFEVNFFQCQTNERMTDHED